MAELTARHSANSRKLIAENTAIRMNTELRHTKQKGMFSLKFLLVVNVTIFYRGIGAET
jgi:hypothetical protein